MMRKRTTLPLETMPAFHDPSRTQFHLLDRHMCLDHCSLVPSGHTAVANEAVRETLYYRPSFRSSTESDTTETHQNPAVHTLRFAEHSVYF